MKCVLALMLVASAWAARAKPAGLVGFDRAQTAAAADAVFAAAAAAAAADECPPCFNCNLPNFECTQFLACNAFTGMCECKSGYGGVDCLEPLCGGLSAPNDRRPQRGDDATCRCAPGFGGINCNLCTADAACDALLPEGLAGTCYQQGIVVNKFHSMCDVTNQKIVAILNGKKPQATFSCDRANALCDFQFWIDERELFYCDLQQCDFGYNLRANTTHYACLQVACQCLPGRMLCGESGLIDISEFLTETIRGPGDFSCDVARGTCRFSEPAMNDLIELVFGDPHITLACASGECLHRLQIPGYDAPRKRRLTVQNVVLMVGVALVCGAIAALLLYNISKLPLFRGPGGGGGGAPAGDVWGNALSHDFQPATLSFDRVSYRVGDTHVLHEVYGTVQPRQCLAIMGGLGAGKTTLLDILAGKNKSGAVSGDIRINGNVLAPKDFGKIVGFVDQEDHLISTLTVYETVLNSALLRLPRAMPLHAKEARVVEVLNELRIWAIRDRVVGLDYQRGILGGEKRRVLIACELVTLPLVLFLDEPTSGLDLYNARNVVELLVKLSRDFERTIVFTIHQPRSNIVLLFDKLVLLSEGDLVYLGDMIKCNDFFARHGYQCPLGYNIADYLIDITVDHKKVVKINNANAGLLGALAEGAQADPDPHAAFVRLQSETDTTREWEHFAVHRDEYNYSAVKGGTQPEEEDSTYIQVHNKLPQLYAESALAAELKHEIAELALAPTALEFENQYVKASFVSQVGILLSRTFKNLYRNPKLLLSHYLLLLAMGAFCGFLYYDVQNDISGFQNRLGLFLFVLSLFGFLALTGLHSFASERIIFIRERANNYYHPLSYYLSKILCDVVPLRVFPPVILISIMYPLVGLSMENNAFLKCILVLVLFNLAVAIEVLIIGILIREPGAATMVAVLTMLLSLLFAGLFINSDDLMALVSWLQWILCFHYAYEALTINEIKDLILREKKYGLSIEVPGAVILSSFGFNVGAFWKDATFLGAWIVTFLALGYVFLHFFTVEKR
jgi:ABC-type multidrug transport system ATPase subunit/ABC-type multidrug transport system permease subunit